MASKTYQLTKDNEDLGTAYFYLTVDPIAASYEVGNTINATAWFINPNATEFSLYVECDKKYTVLVDDDSYTSGKKLNASITVPAEWKSKKIRFRTSYRMRAGTAASNGNSVISDWFQIEPVNTSPRTPSSISVPSAINGGSTITVSWGASTDSEGNLEGYIVERSVDGGSVWTQIYQGSGRSTTNTVAFGTASVMYRVKAYDTEGLQSGWRTSQQITVLNNNAPSAPGSIAVPEMVNAGQAFVVTWSAASDSDGDLAGYSLERQLNGGSWTEVYNGAALAYTETLEKGWNTVAYRVCAYDAHTAYSGYATSPTRAVNNNSAPMISGQDAALGLKTGSFSQSYTVTDAENDTVTVTEFVDQIQLRSYTAALGQAQAVTVPHKTWLTLANGNHQLRIEASDGNAAAVRVWTFSKKETVICFRLAAPEETDAAAAKVLISPTWNVTGAKVKIEACNNAFDAAPAWEDITAMVLLNRVYNFQNKAKMADKWGVDFRFTIEKNEGYDGEISITGFGGAYE